MFFFQIDNDVDIECGSGNPVNRSGKTDNDDLRDIQFFQFKQDVEKQIETMV